MIKTLKIRFVATAMTAITILLAFLLGAINITHFVMSNRQIERIMTELTAVEGSYTPPQRQIPQTHPRRSPFPESPTPDDLMGARFFFAVFDQSGELDRVNANHIYAVTEEEAKELANSAYDSGESEGEQDQFRYRLTSAFGGENNFLIFLDISTWQSSIYTVLFMSMVGGLICWLVMLLLVILLSRRAITPIARNIEKQKQFVTNAGHEIKTPLAIIQSNLDAMELHTGENKWSGNIRTQTVRLTGLMQNLLTLARTDEGGALPMTDFSGNLLLEEALDPYHELAAAKDVAIRTDIQPDVTLHANRESMMQMISVLLDNAVKYAPSGGFLSVSLKQAEKKILLRVENSCAEPPDSDLARLFDRFYRGDQARTQSSGGYGIGLSAAQAVAQLHKGSISAEYDPNRQVIAFTVKLPS